MKKCISLLLIFISSSLIAQKVELIVPSFHADQVSSIALSPDKTLLATCSGNDDLVKIWSYPEMQLLKNFNIENPGNLEFTEDGNYMLVSAKQLTLINTKNLSEIKTDISCDKATLGKDNNIYVINYEVKDKNFALLKYNITTKTKTLLTSFERAKRYQSEHYVNVGDMVFSPNKSKLLILDYGGFTHIYDIETNQIISQKHGPITFITDNEMLYIDFAKDWKSGSFTSKNLNGETLWTKTLAYETISSGGKFNASTKFDRKTKTMYYKTRTGFIYGNYETGNLKAIDVENVGDLHAIAIVDNDYLITIDKRNSQLMMVNRNDFTSISSYGESVVDAQQVNNTNQYATFKISDSKGSSRKDKQITLQPNGLKVTTLASNSYKYNAETYFTATNKKGTLTAKFNLSQITVTNTSTNQSVRLSSQNKSEVHSMKFVADNFLVSLTIDNKINLWDAISGSFLGNIYVFQTSDEWAFVAADGRFDASEKALKSMYYTKGREIIPLEQLYEGFYTPNLLGQILGRRLSPPPAIVIDDIKSPPSVTLKYEQGTRNLTVEDDQTVEIIKTTAVAAKIIVNATAPNDKVAELRLYHNGKLITNKSRNLTVEDDVSNNTLNKIYEIELLPGTNSFKAVALNSQRTESAPAMLTVNLEGEKAKPKTGGIQLYMVVVGINEYKNPKYNLNYAVADANAFQDAIKNGMSTITSKVNVTFIKNSEADRNNIYAKLQEIANNANPQDVFIFYYAGHGMMSEEANPDFYLVPHDVTQIYGDDGGIKKKGISATELKLLASKIPAQKQLYVLDACQSAGALTSVASRGAGEEKAIAQLARSTGTHWLTASGSQQFATEFDQLGHGIFTYVFLEALKGKADSGDGRITVNEIKAYLESQVPELSQKYNGSPQYPASFGFGQDFPVGVKN